MSTSGAVTLGDIADRLPMLEVGCTRCERYGRLLIDRLIQRYGRGAKLPDLRDKLASECPRIGATSIYDRCGMRYPRLVVRQ
jgi:hypothetical protein